MKDYTAALDARAATLGTQIQAFVDDFCQCPPSSPTETRLLAERL